MTRNAKHRAAPARPIPSELLTPLKGIESVLETSDGTRLRVVENGTGRDVLMVHGYGMSADAWSLVQPALVALGHRVVAYDQRGHNRSTVGRDGVGSRQLSADIQAVAEAFDLCDATLVCHSVGNFVALSALSDPTFRKRFRRAVLVNPMTGNAGHNAPTARAQIPLIRSGLFQRLARIRPIGSYFARASLGPEAAPEIVEATRATLEKIPRAVVPYLPMMLHESVEEALLKVDLPLHVLSGTADRTTPPWHAELIVARAPHAKIDYFDDVGHMINWEVPEAIVEAVIAD